MEQLGQEDARRELDQRHGGGMGEAAIGLAAHLGEVGLVDLIFSEGADHPGGDLGVGHVGEAGDLGGRNLRPGLGHIEAAVGGQAAQHSVHKAHVWRLPARGNVPHQPLIRLKTAAP